MQVVADSIAESVTAAASYENIYSPLLQKVKAESEMFSDYSGEVHTWVVWALAVLSFIAFCCTLTSSLFLRNIKNLNGKKNKHGMRRLIMFNYQPYAVVLYLACAFVVSIVIGAVILFLVGGVSYLLLWLVKIILIVLLIVGYIALGLGLIMLFLVKSCYGIIPAVIGGINVAFGDTFVDWGNICVDAGLQFFNTLNLWEFSKYLFSKYAVTVLIIAAIPIAIGVLAMILSMLCAFIFWLVETIMTRKYNINHPCPFCHEPSEPAVYLSENIELPIKLRPGVYGLFHIKHPSTGEKMPTMLLNGRDNLTRRCPHCQNLISYKTGVEKHIAFVGLPESGKTCLTYRFVGNIMRGNDKVRFTDDVNKEAQKIILDIKEGKEQELASKTSVNEMRRSLQILVPGAAPLPYHFFINDVGGELFTNSGVDTNQVQFFKDVESVSVLIDPFTMDFSDYDITGDFAEWYKKNVIDSGKIANTEKLSSVIQTVMNMSLYFVHKNKDIHMNIVLVKCDTGYIAEDIVADEAMIKDFVINQMGLAADVNDLENTYASLHFYAVSALKDTGIDKLTKGIFESLRIKL
jgi:GTPase SAR1 family protein